MILCLDLCLEKNKSFEGKDSLHQYRSPLQSQVSGSLEIMILYLVEKAEKKRCGEGGDGAGGAVGGRR